MTPLVTRLDRIAAILGEHVDVARAMASMAPDIEQAADRIAESMRVGGTLFLAGNGGSAADAQHIASELTGRFLRERRPLPALALHVNSSALTAVGNDYGFEHVFARELSALGRAGDVLLAISTSGNSANILHAIAAAREKGMHVIGLTGAAGGQVAGACDLALRVPSASTQRIQEMHILIGHTICELLDEQFS